MLAENFRTLTRALPNLQKIYPHNSERILLCWFRTAEPFLFQMVRHARLIRVWQYVACSPEVNLTSVTVTLWDRSTLQIRIPPKPGWA